MMRYEDINWKGESFLSRGLFAETQAQYVRPSERIERITVPGRSGTLSLREGSIEVYDPVLYTPVCYAKKDVKIEDMGDYLSGEGMVVFGSMPDRAYRARLINQIPFTALDEDLSYKIFTPVFECQPLAYQASPQGVLTVTQSGQGVQNLGNFYSWPKIKIFGSGDITLSIGSSHLELKNIEGGIVLDSELGDALNLSESLLENNKVTGALPRLERGNNLISFSGNVQRLEIDGRWRYL